MPDVKFPAHFGLCTLMVVLLACGRVSHQPRKVIGVVPKGVAALFWQSLHAGVMSAGRDFNVEVLWNGPSIETDYSRQIQIVDAMISRHVDGLAISASDHTALNGVIERASRVGIPVTVFDSGVDTTDYMTFLATNNPAAGEMAARKVAELLHGKGEIAMVMHVPGSVSTGDREARFEEVLKRDFPGIHIAARQFGSDDRAVARAAAENILSAHPRLSAIFASAEAGTLGAALALKARGLAGKVRMVGFDSSYELVEDLKSGVVDALVIQDPFRIGYETVRTLVDQLGGKIPPKRIDLSARVITRIDLDKPEVKAMLFPNLGVLNN
jgi:ribose transport system substrate-binding protein